MPEKKEISDEELEKIIQEAMKKAGIETIYINEEGKIIAISTR